MCGIAGIFHYKNPDCPIDRSLLTRMTRRLAHRGPDGEGFFVNGSLGLGHRRLAIVDLSATGHQPMSTEDGSGWIVYNGEFYNHTEFRNDLAAQGYRFRGTSDTETLLYFLANGRLPLLSNVRGIFTFAYWDAHARRLVLARDQLGVKQLYYYDDGEKILFASEIKALLECCDIAREPDMEAINQYLHFHLPLFERTFLRHIKQVKAGQYLEIDVNGVRAQTYWRVDDFTPVSDSVEESVHTLKELLGTVTNEQLMADVAVGAFFSGGIDSSAIAAFAQQQGRALQCFGVHFSNQGVIDERPYQEEAARTLGLELELITLDGSSFPDDILKLIYYQDQPVIGVAMLPMYYVSKLAAQRVKVCLGGQAADELFGGYARYALAHPVQVLKTWFAKQQAVKADGIAPSPHTMVGGNLFKQLSDWKNVRRLIKSAFNLYDWRSRYFDHFAKIPESDWHKVFANNDIVSRHRAREIFQETLEKSPAIDPADKLMHWDFQTYLTGLFHQDDRMSMANSLESRVPFADPRIASFAFRCGFDLKLR
ncbi:MAG: asparagine synthase (glutamine-hydrolyzing), partial [Acidobacteriota bacterium]